MASKISTPGMSRIFGFQQRTHRYTRHEVVLEPRALIVQQDPETRRKSAHKLFPMLISGPQDIAHDQSLGELG
jgi:hypothetical protein